MSLKRKDPLHFDLRYGSPRRQLALAPFSGLDLNENPLTANKGSCSDMLNMVVDDNNFLTLRPRLIDDPEYIKARQMVEDVIQDIEYPHIVDQRYVKDGYLFLVGAVAKQDIVTLTITDALTLPDNSGMGFVVQVKVAGVNYELSLSDDFTYSKTLLTIAIFESINQHLDLPFTMVLHGSTITFTFIENGWHGSNYIIMPTNPFGIEVPHVFSIIQQGVLGIKTLLFYYKDQVHWLIPFENPDLKHLTSFDDFLIYPEKDYYRFIRKIDGKNFILKLKDDRWEFEELEPYIPIYKGAIETIEALELAPINEDLNILTNKYKITVDYKTSTPINLNFFEKNAIEIEGDVLKTKEYDIPSTAIIIYQDDSGFVYYLHTDYEVAITSNDESTLFPFYYYSYLSKDSETFFTIKVYKDPDGDYPNRVTQTNLQRLYVSSIQTDSNGKKIPPFYYDVTSHSLLRYRIISSTGDVHKSGWNFYQYSIDNKEFHTKSIYTYRSGDDYAVLESDFYDSGEIALFFRYRVFEDLGLVYRAMIVYNALGNICYSLIGQVESSSEEEWDYSFKCAKADGPKDHLYIKPLFYFEADGKKRLISNGSLAFLLDQRLVGENDNFLTPNNPNDYRDDEVGLYFYYDVTGTLEPKNFYDLTRRFTIIEYSNQYFIQTAGRYTLMYTKTHDSLFLLDTEYPDQSVHFNIANIRTDPSIKHIYSFHPSPWGNVYGYVETKDDRPAFLIISREATTRYALTQYSYHVIKDVPLSTTYYFITEGIILRSIDGSTIYKTEVSDGLFTYTYDLTNENNPLPIKQEILDEFKERQDAFKFTGEVSGRTLITDALLYYNEFYTFVTDPDFKNYNYIPTIHCQKSLNPIRFASSYLQELGVVYQQNSITYLGWDENPFKDTTFLEHKRILQYDHLEQRAIDYLPNGHLVTFAGLTIYLNNSGVYALNFEPETPQDTERRATLISGAINHRLLKEDLNTAILANFDPYILILFPKDDYTSVYALKLMLGQWYYWELPFEVKQILDDNISLRLINGDRYVRLNEDVELIEVFDDNRVEIGSVEKYLDFGLKPIKWYWKSQPIHLGSITARKQITQTHFVFLNPNASFDFDRDTFDLTHSQITRQRFGVRFYAFQEHVTERPSIDYEAELQIINNIQRRTYINRFKYCQLLCYNIDDENATSDKVRLGDIVFTYKVLSGGK